MKLLLIALLYIFSLVSGDLNLQNVDIPDIDDFSVIKEKCDKAGGNGTYDALKAQKATIQTCVENFVDVNALKNEVEESKKTGSMDEVFGKYCRKREKFGSCLQGFVNALRSCLNEEEKKALNTTLDVLKQLGDFACFRDGDRIAMFIAEGGVECIQSRTEGIKTCVNSTLKVDLNASKNSFPNLLIDKQKCDDLSRLQSCVVAELEKCTESTPANIVDALFRFIKRHACTNKNKRSIHKIVRRSVALVSNVYNVEEMRGNVFKEIKEKCSQNAPKGAYLAYIESFGNMTECINIKIHKEPFLVTPVDKFKENLKICTQGFVEKTKICLADEEKYWPQFNVDVALNLVDFAYANKNKLTEQATGTEFVNCFQNFKQAEAKSEIIKCAELLRGSGEIPDKKTLCTRLDRVKTCVSEQVAKRCIREITIVQFIDGMFTAMKNPCKEIEPKN